MAQSHGPNSGHFASSRAFLIVSIRSLLAWRWLVHKAPTPDLIRSIAGPIARAGDPVYTMAKGGLDAKGGAKAEDGKGKPEDVKAAEAK